MDKACTMIIQDEIFKYMQDKKQIKLAPEEDLVTFFIRNISEKIKAKKYEMDTMELKATIENELIIIHQRLKFKFIQ